MKRILIIFFGMLLTCNLGLAKSVSCWEEYSAKYNPNTVSMMKSVLGDDVTIKRVKTEVSVAQHLNGASTYYFNNVNIPLTSYLSYSRDGYTYYMDFSSAYADGRNSYIYQSRPYLYTADGSKGYGYIYYYFAYSNNYSLYAEYAMGAYKHTYCIVDEGSSGGGGGGATGSVNFIIKATS